MFFFCEFGVGPLLSKLWLVRGSDEALRVGQVMDPTGFFTCLNDELEAILYQFLAGEDSFISMKEIDQGAIISDRDGRQLFLSNRILQPLLDNLEDMEASDRSTVDLNYDLGFTPQGDVVNLLWPNLPLNTTPEE